MTERVRILKGLIVYFSQSGTTAKVAESIATGIRRQGYQVDVHSIQEKQQSNLSGYDLVGIGSPVYYYGPPFIVTDYLNNLPDLGNLPVFTFVLHGTYPFDTGKLIQQILTRKGAQAVDYFHCFGADFYLGYLKEGYLFSPDHPTPAELSSAEDFGGQIVERVAGNNYSLTEECQPPKLVYRLERFLQNRWLSEQIWSRFFWVDKKDCSLCGLCMKICPCSNISGGKDGYPVWGRHCLMCLMCQLKCPEDAVTTPISWPLVRPFAIYNVRRASQDPSIDHVRVVHSKGNTRRVDALTEDIVL
ncbi:MAG: EFR1 family ferrodoxin [Dehalococcoidia bacterium]|nr:MAG: EFR1 family ferrodoxin [Dehalococcoidia bacterium]